MRPAWGTAGSRSPGAWWGGPNDPVHTIRIVNAGTSGHSRVDLDGILTVTED